MKDKKSYISCNLNSKLYIYPFLLPISCMFTHFFQKIMLENSNPVNSYKLLKYNFPFLFYYFLPKLLSIIIIHIIKLNTQSENNKGSNLHLRRYHFLIQNGSVKKFLSHIFIISLLEVSFKIGDSILMYLQKIGKIHFLIEKKTGFIISVPFFSYLILYKKLYKHHIVALVLALVGAFIINYCRFPLGFSILSEYLYHFLNLLFSFLFALSLVLIKYLLIKYFISPYIFLFYDGIFCIINSFIFILLEYPIITNILDINKYINVEEENKEYYKNNFLGIFTIFIGQKWKFYFGFFFSFIFSFCYFIFNTLTIYNFSPYINVLTDFLTPYFYNFVDCIFLEDEERIEKNYKRYIWELVGYTIIIFGALILNEIIIFNFYGLNENTYNKIAFRGTLDSTMGLYNGLEDSITSFNNTENETDDEM